MSPAQVLCAVAVFALVQMVIGAHRTTTLHGVEYPTVESAAPRLDLEPFVEWLIDGLQQVQAANALEDPEVAARDRR